MKTNIRSRKNTSFFLMTAKGQWQNLEEQVLFWTFYCRQRYVAARPGTLEICQVWITHWSKIHYLPLLLQHVPSLFLLLNFKLCTTFLSPESVANFVPFGEKLSPVGNVLLLANSNRSVSSFDSNNTHLGNLNSVLGPVQYSSIPARSTDNATSNTGLYCGNKNNIKYKVIKNNV